MQQNKLYIIENIQNSTVCVFFAKKNGMRIFKASYFYIKNPASWLYIVAL